MSPIIEKLNTLYPSLGITVDNVAGKLDGLSGAIDRAAESSSMQAKYDAAKSNLADLLMQEEQLADVAAKAEAAQLRAGERFVDAAGDNYFFRCRRYDYRSCSTDSKRA